MKSFLDSNTSRNRTNNLANTGAQRVLQYVRNAAVALTLSNGVLQADELMIPPGTSIVYANSEQADFLRERSFMCHELGELGDGQKVLFIKTDTTQTLTVNQGEDFPVYYYGDKERLFARLNLTTGETETSENLVDWVISGEEEKIAVNRENPGIIAELEQTTQIIQNLSEQQEFLAITLVNEVLNLEEIQHSLDVSVGDMIAKDQERNTVSTLTDETIGEKEALEITMGPESQLREDTHPIVSSTVMADDTKTIETEEALATYHEMMSNPAQLSPMESGEQSVSTVPNLSDVNSTIAYLLQELLRIQGNIDTVNGQIISKQNDINGTQNTIQTLQNSINQLTTQITQYANNYTYWRDEYDRLITLITSYNSEVTAQSANYSNGRSVLMNVGRSDIPSDITASDVASRLIGVKSTILNEYNAVPYTSSTGPVGSDYNLPDETSSLRYYLDSQYYYVVDFPSSGKSWPAILRVYLKLAGDSNYNQVYSSAVQNRTHAVNLFSNTARIQVEKLAQYRYVDAFLENYYELYKAAQNNSAQNNAPRDTAKINRDNAKGQLDIAYALHDQRQGEMSTLQTQQTLLTQQKADLESLKSLKTNLQNLYNQVQIILNNLKNNITTHTQVTQQIQDLTSQLTVLEEQLADLINIVDDQITVVNEQVRKVSGITTSLQNTNAQISTSKESLIAMLGRNKIIKPRDGINESQLNYNQITEYFSYAHRTSMGPISGTKVPYRAIVEYLDNGLREDLYPANISYEYRINGQIYFTPAHRINNLEHKGVVAEIYKIAITQLESCLNQISTGGDINDGMRKMWEMVEAKITALEYSSDSNDDIREYQTQKNEIISNILAAGSSQAFFDHLMIHEATFRTTFENMLTIIANRHNITEGSSEYTDLKRALIHILAEQFGGEIIESEFAGLDTYTNYKISAESYMAIMANSYSVNQGIVDINDAWSIDEHGNKYKYALWSLGGSNTYPATVWMEYSPDAVSTQTMGPITVSSSLELAEKKERWRKNLLHAKRSHTNYQGGSYDIFQGWGETGEKVWWGQYLYGSMSQGTLFSKSSIGIEKEMRNLIKSSSDLSVKYDFVKYVYKGNLSFDLVQNIRARGETVEQFMREHDATDKVNLLIQRLESELSFGDMAKFQILVGNGGDCDIKRNPNFENISFVDPENNESSVFINGTVVSRAQLGNFLVGYGGREIGLNFPLICAGSLYKQIETYTSNKVGYGLQRLNNEHISQLAELNEKEDRFLYLAGYSYNGASFDEQIESYIEYMRKLSMQQAVADLLEINRIKSLIDF